MTTLAFKGNPVLMASFIVDDTNTGDYLKNLVPMDDAILVDGLIIKNNSDDRLIVTFDDLSETDQICILGRTKVKIDVKSTTNITFSKIGSNDISVSVYGR